MRHRAPVRAHFAVTVAALFVLTPGMANASSTPCTSAGGSGWCVVVHPAAGPIGTRVEVDGDIDPRLDKDDFQDALANLRQQSHFLFLMRDTGPPFCEVIGGVHDAHFSVTDAGAIHGSFVVGGDTSCNHSSEPAPPLTPGVYTVNLGCMSCAMTNFSVTPRAGTLPFTGPHVLWPLVVIGGLSLAAGTSLTACARRRRDLPEVSAD